MSNELLQRPQLEPEQRRRQQQQALSDNPILNGVGTVDAALSAEGTALAVRDLSRMGPRMLNGGLAAATQPGNLARGALGNVLGPISMAQGAAHLMTGNASQGALDLTAGALGTSSALLGLAGVACPPLALAAGVGSLAAFGNQEAQERGWYGREADGTTPSTFLGSIGRDGGEAFAAGRGLFGNSLVERVAGNAVGGVAAGGAGAFRGAYNTGAAVVGAGFRGAGMLGGLGNFVGGGLRSLYGGRERSAAPAPAGDLMNYNYF